MTPSHREQARVRAMAARRYQIRMLLRATWQYAEDKTPALCEALVDRCRDVVAADDALESLGVSRG